MHPRRRRVTVAALVAGVAVSTVVTAGDAAATPAAPAAAPAGPVVVTSGLDNPRQLAFLPDGSVLLVAEAGHGGSDCSGTDPEGNPACFGATGGVDAVLAPATARAVAPNRVVTGLLSSAGPDGSAAVGADGVNASSLSAISVAMTFAPPDVLPGGLPGDQAGKLLRGPAYRKPGAIADVTGYEAAHDPDGQGVDSNPYAVLLLGNRTLVADAAANDIVSVGRDGTVSLFATLPNITTGRCAGQPNDNGTTGCDFVPTSLAVGPDGGIYVGGLGSLTPGAGRVVKLDPVTGAVRRTWTGLTSVTGVAVGGNGAVYASQLSFDPAKGKVTRIDADSGTRTDVAVPFPAGVAVDPRSGSVFVAAFSIAPATGLGFPGSSGQIWKVKFPTPVATA